MRRTRGTNPTKGQHKSQGLEAHSRERLGGGEPRAEKGMSGNLERGVAEWKLGGRAGDRSCGALNGRRTGTTDERGGGGDTGSGSGLSRGESAQREKKGHRGAFQGKRRW